jgi:hypothetical protein
MTYSTNPTVEDVVLTVINDGNGSQCGMTYAQRCEAAEFGIFEFRAACRAYGRYRHRNYGASIPTRGEVIEAADILQAYYREHTKESA